MQLRIRVYKYRFYNIVLDKMAFHYTTYLSHWKSTTKTYCKSVGSFFPFFSFLFFFFVCLFYKTSARAKSQYLVTLKTNCRTFQLSVEIFFSFIEHTYISKRIDDYPETQECYIVSFDQFPHFVVHNNKNNNNQLLSQIPWYTVVVLLLLKIGGPSMNALKLRN